MRAYGRTYGSKFTSDLLNQFISVFVDNLVAEALHRQNGKHFTEEEAYQAAAKDFTYMKYGIQEAVARGFTSAFSRYNGQFVDYYCQIKPIGPAINKKAI